MHAKVAIIGAFLPFITGLGYVAEGCFPMADPSRNMVRLGWASLGDPTVGDAAITHLCQQVHNDTTWSIGTGSEVRSHRIDSGVLK